MGEKIKSEGLVENSAAFTELSCRWKKCKSWYLQLSSIEKAKAAEEVHKAAQEAAAKVEEEKEEEEAVRALADLLASWRGVELEKIKSDGHVEHLAAMTELHCRWKKYKSWYLQLSSIEKAKAAEEVHQAAEEAAAKAAEQEAAKVEEEKEAARVLADLYASWSGVELEKIKSEGHVENSAAFTELSCRWKKYKSWYLQLSSIEK